MPSFSQETLVPETQDDQEQNLAARNCMQHTKDPKEVDAKLAYDERGAAISHALDKHPGGRVVTMASSRNKGGADIG